MNQKIKKIKERCIRKRLKEQDIKQYLNEKDSTFKENTSIIGLNNVTGKLENEAFLFVPKEEVTSVKFNKKLPFDSP